MTCEICGKPLSGKDGDWTSVDIIVHPECSKVIDNIVENRNKQREKLDGIIKEYNKIYEDWLDAIDSDTGTRVKRTTEKLERFKEEEL